MNHDNKDAITSLAFVPRQPSCRKPLNRIMDEKMTKSPILRDSKSRERSVTADLNDEPEISSDDNEESPNDNFLRDNSLGSSYENIYPNLPDLNLQDYEDYTPQSTKQPSPKTTFVSQSSSIEKTSTVYARKRVSSNHSGSSDVYPEVEDFRSKPRSRRSSSKGATNFTKYLFLLVLFSVSYLVFHFWPIIMKNLDTDSSSDLLSEPLTQKDRFKTFRKDLRDIRDKFPNQDRRTWSDIQAGIHDIMNLSSKPWTFVLFSNESKHITCLADLLGTASSKALLSDNQLILEPEDFGNEYGIAIDRWRPEIMKQKVVVVHDVLSIDPGAIQAFHTMCDRYNPLVEGVVYILTLITPGYDPSETPEVFVENQLTNKFVNRVPEDKLQPLITRLTDGPIIRVVPEKSLTGCSL